MGPGSRRPVPGPAGEDSPGRPAALDPPRDFEARPVRRREPLDHLLEHAGNPALMTPGLKDTLVAHADGNPRALAIMADTLLGAGAEHERERLDEKLFLETWGADAQPRSARR